MQQSEEHFSLTSQSTGGVQLVPFLQFRGGQGIPFLSLSHPHFLHKDMDFLSNEASFFLEFTSCSRLPLIVATAPTSHLTVLHFLFNGCLTLGKAKGLSHICFLLRSHPLR